MNKNKCTGEYVYDVIDSINELYHNDRKSLNGTENLLLYSALAKLKEIIHSIK